MAHRRLEVGTQVVSSWYRYDSKMVHRWLEYGTQVVRG